MGKIKLNGWVRLGIVLSAVWVLSVACYMWNNIINEADETATLALHTCSILNPQHFDKCSNVWLNTFQHSKEESLKGWWIDYPLIVFIPPLLIFLIWLFSYGMVRLFYWTKAGFAGTEKPVSTLKESFLLAGVVIGLIALIVIFSSVRNVSRKSVLTVELAKCRLEAIKSNLDDRGSDDSTAATKYNDYVATCMKIKGYSFGCVGSTDFESCYN